MSFEPVSTPQRRKFFRAAVDFPVDVQIAGEQESVPGQSVDLSGGGMRLTLKKDLAPGSNLSLRFRLPQPERDMLVRARVVLSFYDASKQQYAHGVAFTQIAAADQAQIVEFIHELQRGATA